MVDDITIGDIRKVMKDRRILFLALLFAITIIILGGNSLIYNYDCIKTEGFYLENGECYIPNSDTERNEIIKNGFVKKKNVLSFEFGILNST